MATNTYYMGPGQNILVPALQSFSEHLEPVAYGPNLTINRGQAMAPKTSDGKFYPFNAIATDGTQRFEGFAQYSCATDANGLVYLVTGTTPAGATVYTPPGNYSSLYTAGVFNPNDLYTSAVGTAIAEVDTITPTNPTTGDIYSVEIGSGPNAGVGVEVTVAGTQTATATVTLLANAWNANPVLKALATTSGSATFILTAVNAGEPLNLKAGVTGTGTVALVITTAAVSAQQSEVDTFTATNPTTADVYTITITYPNLTTYAVSATVGATQTATAIDALLIAAWNADPTASAYAVASGTATLIMTAVVPGNQMNLSGFVVGTGTIAKVVTKPALGRSIADIQNNGRSSAYVQNGTGYWVFP